ncbi:F-type conjugal transfer protein TrbF [Escherichia coli]|uniref:F-type conjugal transfer protein TrbF n=1 Tax=Escherichia coli TaxID=562 RepID=UPI000A187E15|nr:F-type conjugal transfer protein TrbF [Escherichia coli]OSL84425.1 protein TrbF [Escherichia coli T426]
MKENKKNQEFKIRKIKRGIECNCYNAIKHFGLFVVFFIAGLFLWHGMHSIFSACIDSWKTDPELNNSICMWNIMIYVIPYTLYALAAGFLVTFFLFPMYELIYGNIGIFLLKHRMRRENTLREGSNNASH